MTSFSADVEKGVLCSTLLRGDKLEGKTCQKNVSHNDTHGTVCIRGCFPDS